MTSSAVSTAAQARAILKVLDRVEAGKVTTASDLAAASNVSAEFVSQLAARKSVFRPACTPWHRIVPDNGLIRPAQTDGDGYSQVSLLASEGVPVSHHGEVMLDLCRADLRAAP